MAEAVAEAIMSIMYTFKAIIWLKSHPLATCSTSLNRIVFSQQFVPLNWMHTISHWVIQASVHWPAHLRPESCKKQMCVDYYIFVLFPKTNLFNGIVHHLQYYSEDFLWIWLFCEYIFDFFPNLQVSAQRPEWLIVCIQFKGKNCWLNRILFSEVEQVVKWCTLF